MPLRLRSWICFLALLFLSGSVGFSQFDPPEEEPYSLKNFVRPKPYLSSEAIAKEFSLEKAARFLDSASLDWQKKQKCFTCHTNVTYLYGRPLISGDDPAPREIRQALEEDFTKSFENGGTGPQGFYAVSQATAMAINDSITTKKLHPLTKKALDHMWTVQADDGGMPWGGGIDPIGSAQFGAAIVAVAVAVAPEDYGQTEAAKKGIDGVRSWLAKRPPKKLYDKAMILWASAHQDGLMTQEEKSAVIKELRDIQLADGGWKLDDLKRQQPHKGEERDAAETSDGYATGLVLYALRQAGVSAQDPVITRGITWLKSNQRESGRWLTRNSRGLANTGSVFAVMAIQSCAETPSSASFSLPDAERTP